MQDFITLFLFICCIILFCIVIFKKWQNDTINEDIKKINNDIYKENQQLNLEKTIKQKELEGIEHHLELQKNALKAAEDISKNINEATRKAFEEYCDSLSHEYYNKEQEWDEAVVEMEDNYAKIQDSLMRDVQTIKKDLEKITATRAAAMEAQLKEEKIKNQQAFYCPQVPEDELKDAKTLRDIEYKLNNPRVLRMLIWQTYYQKPMNLVCANVLGAATAEICGIYKITNQKNNLVYIGQAVDMSTRWKNHAKAGLGIDTPANNKLYKAMMQDGLESFSFEILEKCSRDQLNEKEKFYIELYQSDKYGYNSNSGISK